MTATRPAVRIALLTAAIAMLAGCATPPKERTAPCKRPTNALAYGGVDPRVECGPMQVVNANPEDAYTAIARLQEH